MSDKAAATYHPHNTLEEAREAEFVRQYPRSVRAPRQPREGVEMSTTMSCNRCGSSTTGSVSEVIKWDISHDEYCPALPINQAEDKETP
jgi:hypothetical protein